MNILVLTPSLPYPPIWGFGIRVYQILRYLSQRHDVSLLTYGEPGNADDAGAIRALGVDLHCVPQPASAGWRKRKDQVSSLFSTGSFQFRSLRTRQMQSKIDQLLANRSYDLIQVESSQMAGFQFGRRTPLILDEHNIEYELLQRMYQSEQMPLRRLYNWIEYLKFRREEKRCWSTVEACILTSQREKEILAGFRPQLRAMVAPNGVDIEYFQPTAVQRDSNSIVFTGLMRYRPNVDAVLYFVREVLPLIHRQQPGAKFTIVGAGPPPEVRGLSGPSVVVTDRVPDVRPYIASAGAIVVPLRMGSGTRLKILEALAMRKGVISTSLGCEGIDVRTGEHLIVADSPAEFASEALRVLTDEALACRLGEEGRRLAVNLYSWPPIVASIESFHAEIIERYRAATGQEKCT